MADVKRCDRCGAIYEKELKDNCQIQKIDTERNYDLCPHCSEKFNEFIWGKRLENEVWSNGKVY